MFTLLKHVATRGQRLYTTSPCRLSLQGSNGSPGNRLPEACKARLEELFLQGNQKPDLDTVNQLAVEFNEPRDVISFWFENRRELPKLPKSEPSPLHEALEALYLKGRYPKREALESFAQIWNKELPMLRSWFFRRREKEKSLVGEALKDDPDFAPRRHQLTDDARKFLKEYFEKDPRPIRKDILKISWELGETFETIQRYFAKLRYLNKELVTTQLYRPSLKHRPTRKRLLSRLPLDCVAHLEEVFCQGNHKPDFETVNQLAVKLDEPYDAIWFWFRNRREKLERPPPQQPLLYDALRMLYLKTRYPDRETLNSFAQTWNAEYSTLYNWFVRQRKKERNRERKFATGNPRFAPRKRRLSDATRDVLEEYFQNDQRPRRPDLSQLSLKLGETYGTIYRYFTRRRLQHKLKRVPHRLSVEFKEAMEAFYLEEENPTKETMQNLAAEWSVAYVTVYAWFLRRRKREEVPEAEMPDPPSAPLTSRLSDDERAVLEAQFEKDPYPRRPDLLKLCIELNRSYETLYRYFAWRRYKIRKTRVVKRGRPRLRSEPKRGPGRPPTKKLLEF